MVRERWPELPIHLSVQANTTNYASVRFWQSVGVKRIILSRELSLTRSPRSATPARTWSWRSSCMVRCASLYPGAACCRAVQPP